MKEPKEIYFLPVEQLSDDAIQCIEKVFELLDAIKDDCNINNFSRRFTFIREGKAISDVAEIKKDSDGLNHIYINENFCQYLWSVCIYLTAYFENVIHIPMMNTVGINKNGYKPNMVDVEYANDCFFRGRQLLHNFNRDVYWVTPNICNPQQFENIINHANGVYCAAIAFIYAIMKFKSKAVLPMLSLVGLVASILLVVRYTNVKITLFTVLGVAVITIANYALIFKTLKGEKTFKENSIEMLNILIPCIIIAIVFCCAPYIQLATLGMTIFWSIIVMYVYNIIITRTLIDK